MRKEMAISAVALERLEFHIHQFSTTLVKACRSKWNLPGAMTVAFRGLTLGCKLTSFWAPITSNGSPYMVGDRNDRCLSQCWIVNYNYNYN